MLSTFRYAYLNRDNGTDAYSAIVENYILLDFATLNVDAVSDYTTKNIKAFTHMVTHGDNKDGGGF